MTVRLYDVSLRDGLQHEGIRVSTDAKVTLVRRLIAAGVRDLEVTGFVRRRLLPQLADSAELTRQLPRAEGVRYWAFVLGGVGLERAVEAGYTRVSTFMSASSVHSERHLGRTQRESLGVARRVVSSARAQGVQARVYLSMAFGYEEPVAPDGLIDLAGELLHAGACQLALADTVGIANPAQVRAVVRELVAAGVPAAVLALHLHDPHGLAVTNAWVAWEEGVRCFDGALAGLGGGTLEGIAGNVATEDLVHLFDEVGQPTGIDLARVCEAGGFMAGLLERELPGRLHRSWRASPDRAARSA